MFGADTSVASYGRLAGFRPLWRVEGRFKMGRGVYVGSTRRRHPSTHGITTTTSASWAGFASLNYIASWRSTSGCESRGLLATRSSTRATECAANGARAKLVGEERRLLPRGEMSTGCDLVVVAQRGICALEPRARRADDLLRKDGESDGHGDGRLRLPCGGSGRPTILPIEPG